MLFEEIRIETGAGFWNPLVWLLGFIVMLLLAYWLYTRGEKKYKPESEQTLPFLSGNILEEKKLQIKAENLYWGFTIFLEKYYKKVKGMHSGVINDYFTWFMITLALLFLLLVINGIG